MASKIIDIITIENEIDESTKFYDLCCGSGAITLELINRDIIHPSNIIMVDKGCFGEFWNSVANNEFDLSVFKSEIDKLPSIEYIKDYLFEMSKKEIDKELSVYHYLLMQSGSFGGKAIWKEDDGTWSTSSFRNHWLPTPTSNRRSPVNPMMPMPSTLYKRVENIVWQLGGIINAIHDDVFNVLDNINKLQHSNIIVYIDPPYQNTSGYKDSFDIDDFIKQIRKDIPIYVSEGFEMKGSIRSYLLSEGRRKGNITGNINKKPTRELLNRF